ncbi:MAG TPA: TadE family protein [Candidatus Limnocylindrales bacterium]|nr:TadE family protein [Candidatus Limnocylindrales bacterium]
MHARLGSGRRRRGQALVELALTIPLIGVLLMGGFDVTMMISDRLAAAYAVRQGARLAAELGGLQTNPGVSQATIDKKIVRNVLAVTNRMAYGTINEVDIYLASQPGGVYQAGDPIDQWDGSGNPLAGGLMTFTLDKRVQTPPIETSIGVRLLWTYTIPTGNLATMNLNDFTVMKAAPVLT